MPSNIKDFSADNLNLALRIFPSGLPACAGSFGSGVCVTSDPSGFLPRRRLIKSGVILVSGEMGITISASGLEGSSYFEKSKSLSNLGSVNSSGGCSSEDGSFSPPVGVSGASVGSVALVASVAFVASVVSVGSVASVPSDDGVVGGSVFTGVFVSAGGVVVLSDFGGSHD